jgi:hypothetical protein
MTLFLKILAWIAFWWFVATLRPKFQFWIYSTFSAISLFCVPLSIWLIEQGEVFEFWYFIVFIVGFLYFAWRANIERNKYRHTILNKRLNGA